VRERTDTLVRQIVLDDPAPFVPLVITKRRKEVEYEAKAVELAGRRYIVSARGRRAVRVPRRPSSRTMLKETGPPDRSSD
jgi:hypothetical protein